MVHPVLEDSGHLLYHFDLLTMDVDLWIKYFKMIPKNLVNMQETKKDPLSS